MTTHLPFLSAGPGSPEGSGWPAAVVTQSPRQKQKDEAGRAETAVTPTVIRPLLPQVCDPTLSGQDGVTSTPSWKQHPRAELFCPLF